MHKKVTALSKQYGDLFTLYIGPEPHVILNSYKAVKETLIQNAAVYAGRGYWRIVVDAHQRDGVLHGMHILDYTIWVLCLKKENFQ